MHVKKRKWTQLAQEKNLLQNILNTATNLRIAKVRIISWLAHSLASQVEPFSLQLRAVIDYAFSLSPHLCPVYGSDLVVTAMWVILFWSTGDWNKIFQFSEPKWRALESFPYNVESARSENLGINSIVFPRSSLFTPLSGF
jgi:hypothetical protein